MRDLAKAFIIEESKYPEVKVSHSFQGHILNKSWPGALYWLNFISWLIHMMNIVPLSKICLNSRINKCLYVCVSRPVFGILYAFVQYCGISIVYTLEIPQSRT